MCSILLGGVGISIFFLTNFLRFLGFFTSFGFISLGRFLLISSGNISLTGNLPPTSTITSSFSTFLLRRFGAVLLGFALRAAGFGVLFFELPPPPPPPPPRPLAPPSLSPSSLANCGMFVVSQITSYFADIKMSLSGAPPPPLGVVEGDAVSVLSGLCSSNPSSPISIVLGEVFLLGIPLSTSFNLLDFLRPRFPLFFLTFSQSGGEGKGMSIAGASVDIPTFGFGIHSLTSS